VKTASRLDRIPPYLFAEIDRKKKEALWRGVDVISLGIGDPDIPTPEYVIERLRREAGEPANHRYPDYRGCPEFRESVARWYSRRFGVELDPEREVIALIGSKEGLAHIAWAFVEEGDAGLVPDPAYPVYRNQVLLAGGDAYAMPLEERRGYLPDLDAIPRDVRQRATVMFLNYPNNPTAATCDMAFLGRVVEFARENDVLVCYDAAYSEITFDGYEAPSILEIPGAREVAIEFNSLSKPYNMTGWRVAFAAGCEEAVSALAAIKTNTDSGAFTAIQLAAAEALDTDDSRRLDELRETWGTFYVWFPVPGGDSIRFAERVLEETGVIVTPGVGYGEVGEGYARASLTIETDRLREAVGRLEEAGVTYR